MAAGISDSKTGCLILKIYLRKHQPSRKRIISNDQDVITAIIWRDSIFHQMLIDRCDFVSTNRSSLSTWLQSQIILVAKIGDLTTIQVSQYITATYCCKSIQQDNS